MYVNHRALLISPLAIGESKSVTNVIGESVSAHKD